MAVEDMTATRIVVLLLVLASARAEEAGGEQRQEARVSYEGAQLLRVTVPSPDLRAELEKLQDSPDVDTWSALPSNGSSADLLVKAEQADTIKEHLNSTGLTYDVLISDLQEAIKVENPPLTPEQLEELEGRKGHRMTWQAYHRLADIHGYLDFLAQTYPRLVSVQTIGSSIEGRPLKVVKISSDKPGGPAIWLDGGIHAREWISPASVTYIINELVENRDAHGEAVKNVDWYILPVVNPDGYEYSQSTDRLWRKNRRSGNGRCAGTDLNRNFGYKWGGAGSSREPCKEIYAGTGPFSEPETSALRGFVQGIRSNLKAYVSFHSYGQYILYPWGYTRAYTTDRTEIDRVARSAASAMQRVGGGSYTVGSSAITLYPAAGGSDDWAKGTMGVKYAYTIELRDRGYYGFVLPAKYIIPTAKEAMAAVKVLAEEVAKSR